MRLTTERLVLRPPTLDDLDAWHAIYLDAEEVWYGAPRSSLDENREKLTRQIAHFEQHGFGMCAVDLAASGETIGAAGLQHLEGGPEVEVGYRFLKEHWGHGYATESARASIAYGFDEVGLDADRRGRAGDECRLAGACSRSAGWTRSGSRTSTGSST